MAGDLLGGRKFLFYRGWIAIDQHQGQPILAFIVCPQVSAGRIKVWHAFSPLHLSQIVMRTGRNHLHNAIPELLAAVEEKFSARLFRLLKLIVDEWNQIEADIAQLDKEIEHIAKDDPSCQRLLAIPGVGPLTATAMVAAVGNGAAFRKGHEFAAWLGLVPRQVSTGGKPKLLGISKQGNEYLRRLFIHGARSVVGRVNRTKHRFGSWISNLESRANPNVVSVALANKIARIAWAVLNRDIEYCASGINLNQEHRHC